MPLLSCPHLKWIAQIFLLFFTIFIFVTDPNASRKFFLNLMVNPTTEISMPANHAGYFQVFIFLFLLQMQSPVSCLTFQHPTCNILFSCTRSHCGKRRFFWITLLSSLLWIFPTTSFSPFMVLNISTQHLDIHSSVYPQRHTLTYSCHTHQEREQWKAKNKHLPNKEKTRYQYLQLQYFQT